MKAITKEDFDIRFNTTQKLLSMKWALHILYAMRSREPLLQKELAELLPYVGGTSLRRHLKTLTGYGIIVTDTRKGIIPRKEYSLSEQGKKLVPAVDILADWEAEYVEYFKAHMEEISRETEEEDMEDMADYNEVDDRKGES